MATRVRNSWVLAVVTAAAVLVAAGAAWRRRWLQQVRRLDEQDFDVEDGCLVLASGRLPVAGEVIDPVLV